MSNYSCKHQVTSCGRFAVSAGAVIALGLFFVAIIGATAYARFPSIDINPSTGTYEPLTGQGLFSTASGMEDTMGTNSQTVKRAAVYAGDGIEPMADASAQAAASGGWPNQAGESATAEVIWPYKIIRKDGQPHDPSASIPVKVDYRMHLSVSGTNDYVAAATICAGSIFIRPQGSVGNYFAKAQCNEMIPAQNGACVPGRVGTLSFTVSGSMANRGLDMQVVAYVSAHARGWDQILDPEFGIYRYPPISGSAEAHCVVDPYMYIHPAYADEYQLLTVKSLDSDLLDPSSLVEPIRTPVDWDGDGYFSDVDCDDLNPTVNPGAVEVVDGIDNDCDGLVDKALLFVDTDATGANNGTSWQDAYNYLQDALEDASSLAVPSEIWVAEGTYKPDEGVAVTPSDREATFQLIDGVAIYGGFAGTETSLDERDWETNVTTLSGDLNGNDVQVADPHDLLTEPTRSENSYTIVTADGTYASTVLDGFTITAATDGGMVNENEYGSPGGPTVANCTFSGNSTDDYEWGGAITNDQSSPTIMNCTFSGNYAEDGGAINNFYNDAQPTIINCTFSGNSGEEGGAIYSYCGSPTIINSTFSGNSASGYGAEGGAICSWDSYNPIIVINCTFSGNSSEYYGGAITSAQSESIITNCTFWGNTAKYGGGISSDDDTITNCILWGNTDNGGSDESAQIDAAFLTIINYSCVQGWSGTLGGSGNIGDDPLFVNADDNLRLSADSNCIDAGDNTAVPADTADLDGDGDTTEPIPWDLDSKPRFIDDPCTTDTGNGTAPIVDMGAYEYRDNTPAGTDVEVQPVDSKTGTQPVTVTFDEVTETGETSLTTSDVGDPPPFGFQLGDPPTYYQLITTATFSGSIEVCIDYSGISFASPSDVNLYHFEDTDGDDVPDDWVNCTVSVDTVNKIICGTVTSFSLFAIFEPENQPPIADAGPDQTVECTGAEGTAVTLDGSASNDPDCCDPLAFEWRDEDDNVVGTSPWVNLMLPLGAHTFTLIVDDGRGGTETDTITVTVQDTTAPFIWLNGPDMVWLQCGVDTYTEEGATATDICEEDVPVIIGDTVDTSTCGTYVVTYDATDSWGNEAVQVTRTVHVVDMTALTIKSSAIDELEAAKIGDKKIDKELDKIIKHIQKSLEDNLWIDVSHLNSKHGKKVFDEEEKAAKKLMHLMDKKGKDKKGKKDVLEVVKDACLIAIAKLIEADDILAGTIYNEALNAAGNPKVDKELEKCDKEFEKADKELAKEKYDKAIDHYKKAWEHAQKAIKHANK